MPETGDMGGFLGKTSAGIPNWGWGIVIAGGVIVGYFFTKSKAVTNQTTSTAVPVTDTSGQPGVNNAPLDQGNPVLTVPGGASGNVPILPPGYTPIYDSNGNLVAFEPPGSPPIGTVPTSGSPGSPSGATPLIPYDFFHPHYFPVHPGGVFNYQGVSYYIVSDLGGVIKGVPGAKSSTQAAGKSQVTLYAPSTFYH